MSSTQAWASEPIAIVGSGLMACGIAEIVSSAGIEVRIAGRSKRSASTALQNIERSLAREVERDRLTPVVANEVLARISVTTDLQEAVQGTPLVIESVIEDIEIKRTVFAILDEVADASAVLASNTSAIPISELAASTTRPERVLGLHFFSPAQRMSLVEVVSTLRTSDAAQARALRLVERIGKHHIVVGDRSGFVVNFLIIPFLLSAIRLHGEGVSPAEDIDRAIERGCNHPLGPLRLADRIGLDVVLAISESLDMEYRRPEFSAPPNLRRMVSLGMLGHKSGSGFYQYEARPSGAATEALLERPVLET